jgi:hypothetical protein
MKLNVLLLFTLAVILCSLPSFGVQPGTLFIDLRTGTSTVLGPAPPGVAIKSIGVSSLSNTSNCPGTWYEALVDINLQGQNNSARTAYMTVEYEGKSYGWTADIGDSATDDGYGGNSGGAEHAAEAQVANDIVSVYNDPKVPGQVDLLYSHQASLTNGGLKFTVTNEKITVGEPSVALSTPYTKTLFAIPDPLVVNPNDPEKWSIHAGFNRVVNPNSSRVGCGARSIAIWTE